MTRDPQAVKRFFSKALGASHTVIPRVITVGKNAAYPKVIHELKAAGVLATLYELRGRANISTIWLNKIIARIKRLVKPGLGFLSFERAWRTLQGYEAMHMIRKGQLQGVEKGDVQGQVALIARLFEVAAEERSREPLPLHFFLGFFATLLLSLIHYRKLSI